MNALPLLLSCGTLAILLLPVIIWLCRCLLWPRVVRKCHCPWCWKALHVMRFYPQWSSTICRYHNHRMSARSAARRQARLQAQGALGTQERR